MDVNIFTDNLNTKVFGRNTVIFESIDSTNTKMIEDLNNGLNLEEGSVYIALKQTNGKGSFGNSWQSDNNLGLWCSILAYSPYKKNPISLLPGIALTKLLKEKYNIDAHSKWPNDVLIKTKKISGTLIQVIPTNDKKQNACIIGVGVNLYHKKEDFDYNIKDKATSLLIETNKKVEIENFYKDFIKYFEDIYYNEYSLIDLFKTYTKMIGKKIKAKNNNIETDVFVKDITKEGYLIVETYNEEKKITKEETWISRASLDIDTNY